VTPAVKNHRSKYGESNKKTSPVILYPRNKTFFYPRVIFHFFPYNGLGEQRRLKAAASAWLGPRSLNLSRVKDRLLLLCRPK